jgi:hypothetical protein
MSSIKNMSLFIPHVFPCFNEEYVEMAFQEVGEIDRVDFVAKQDRDGKSFNAVYVHFKKWYNNAYTVSLQEHIIENGSTKFYHDDTWFWLILPNTAKKHASGGVRKPRIDLSETKETIEKTPEKLVEEPVCPPAPKKTSYAQMTTANDKPNPVDLNNEFEEYLELLRAPIEEWDVEASEEELEMAEIEAEMDAEDDNLVSIDWRYIKTVEEENMYLHCEVAQLRQALINLDQMYQAEVAKVRALSKEPVIDEQFQQG